MRVDYTSQTDTCVFSQLAVMGPLQGLGIAMTLIGVGEQRVRARGLAFAALGVEDSAVANSIHSQVAAAAGAARHATAHLSAAQQAAAVKAITDHAYSFRMCPSRVPDHGRADLRPAASAAGHGRVCPALQQAATRRSRELRPPGPATPRRRLPEADQTPGSSVALQ
jgi:hypothetical protein